MLSLRHSQGQALTLTPGESRQEVLLLAQPLRNRRGQVVLPADTQVLGRFEFTQMGPQFVVEGLFQGQGSQPLAGQSGILSGSPQVESGQLLRNSGLGAAAVTVLTGFTGIGLLGGAVLGAATTYVTAPQPIVIQPNQVIEVRLVEPFVQATR